MREKLATPIRPWTRTRIMRYWRNHGAACSSEVGLKRSSSNARARWVKTTRRNAVPRSPYDQPCQLRLCLVLNRCRYDDGVNSGKRKAKRESFTYIHSFHALLSITHPASASQWEVKLRISLTPKSEGYGREDSWPLSALSSHIIPLVRLSLKTQ